MHKVLILGAGLVARPIVQYLSTQEDVSLTVADLDAGKARALVAGKARARGLAADVVGDPAQLDALVADADLVVSLLPYVFHVNVARACLAHRRHLVTSSYVSPAMRELDAEAREADVILLNELGLDPGIDHMSACRIIDDVHDRGGRIVAFRSFCGGLPAPEANDNPFGYKFSWSPAGVIRAGRNSARWLEDGEVREVPGKELFDHAFMWHVDGAGDFEAYPNRDSVPYVDLYGIPETRTMLRGTLRNPGWCETWKQIYRTGLADEIERPDLAGVSLSTLTRTVFGIPLAEDDLRGAVASRLGIPREHGAIGKLDWLGFFGDDTVPEGLIKPFDVLVAKLQTALAYGPNERDQVVLCHNFEAEFDDGSREHITSTLVDFGIPGGDSAMSRTVSLPAAMGARLILDGAITERGVRIPVHRQIYVPILERLEGLGIVCREATTRV